MKHLPNLLTLGNLFFGCLAIVFIMDSPTYLKLEQGDQYLPLLGVNQLYWGSIFIGIAALFDVFDGLAARSLKAHSPLGKDLDSLADLVSFGVAPAMIMYKLLWRAYMAEPGALDLSVWVMAPAFLLPCFGALRLARYNQTADEQKDYFIGVPIPAMALLVASLPLIHWFPTRLNLAVLYQNRWILYGLILILSGLMVSKRPFLKWKAAGSSLSAWMPQLLLALTLISGFIWIKFSIIPIVFGLYLILSLIVSFKNKNHDVPSTN